MAIKNTFIFIRKPHATKRGPEKIYSPATGHAFVEYTNGEGNLEIIELDYRNIQGTIDDNLPDPLSEVGINQSLNRVEFYLRYYYDETLDRPQIPAAHGSENYPNYPRWNSAETQVPLVANTEPTAEELAAIKTANLEVWRTRLNKLAFYFETMDGAQKWAVESSGDKSAISSVIDDANQARLNNTSRHWVKGIGMANRVIGLYENSDYTDYAVPARVRSNPADGTSEVVIDTTTGAGISEMLTALEVEYRIAEYEDETVNNPLLIWHYAAGSEANRAIWSAYYGARQWWFTNYDTAQGLYSWFTAAAATAATDDDPATNDWADLWDEFVKARDYK